MLNPKEIDNMISDTLTQCRRPPRRNNELRIERLLIEGQVLMNALSMYADSQNWTEDGRFVPTVKSSFDPTFPAREAIDFLRTR
jgi:hypothetical protein